jgi:hypothetical protein
MKFVRAAVSILAFSALGASSRVLPLTFALPARAQQSQQTSAATRRIGAIKAINGNSLTLTPDSGADVTVTLQGATRILRIAPGEKDLKNATPIQFQDLQVGDRILVGGQSSEDAKSMAASSVVVMKRSDVEARQQQELQDWQKRGLGGLVSAVDNATGTITISVTSFGGTKSVTVHVSKQTVIRRYAPDSVKFDDANPSSLAEIHSGDQLRARGNRSVDGTELTAEEIVTGRFRNLAGIINSVDASAGTINVQDLMSQKPAQVKITRESQLRKLPPEMAQRIAARLKGAGAATSGSDGSVSASATAPNGSAQPAPPPGRTDAAKMGMRSGRAPDLQQMLSHLPAIPLSDLHKGDAVMIVSTLGDPSGAGTAITLLSGVEPILQAAPGGSPGTLLSPWSLAGAPSGEANQ